MNGSCQNSADKRDKLDRDFYVSATSRAEMAESGTSSGWAGVVDSLVGTVDSWETSIYIKPVSSYDDGNEEKRTNNSPWAYYAHDRTRDEWLFLEEITHPGVLCPGGSEREERDERPR